MAIIVDPDNLTRRQVIFGTENQQVSIRDVGTVVSSALLDQSGGLCTSSSLWFTGSAGTDFVTNGATAGDTLCIFDGEDAGHWIIGTVDSETVLTMDSTVHTGSFAGSSVNAYDVRDTTGGTVVDGITEQAIYSFAKEEWRTDSEVFDGDDLIRHPFPFEAITREQMELGGGTAHDAWDYNTRDSEYTKKKVRTGGWANVSNTSTTLESYSGIITLGNVDTDAQVYYQQINTGSAPVDFTFQGPVNEAILVNTSGGLDRRTYLKLFVRKKYRSYAGSEISDIGVSTLETIVNRFPLAHSTDPAIVATEGAIIGSSPFHNQNTLTTGADGSKASGSLNFESLGSTFVSDGVRAGDTLNITNGTDTDYYTIGETPLIETSVTCSSDVDFTGFTATEGTLDFTVTTTDVIRQRFDDGEITDVDTSTGTITGSAGFTAAVAANDILVINESAYSGAYKVNSVDSDTQLTIDTSDQPFPAAPTNNIDYYIAEPGMYLQYKKNNIELVNGGQFTFEGGTPPAITRSLGSWASDGVTAGTVITVAGSTSNDGSYTVLTQDTATEVTLVPTDSLVDEGPVTVTSGAFDAFKRSVAGVTYAFRWRLFGNNTTLANQFQFVQKELRATTDIDFGNQVNRGDITDLLMTFASPTATTLDMYIDDLDATDTNNVTWTDATGVTRVENFVSAGSISFNNNLQNDASAIYVMFYTNDDAGDNLGRDYGTPTAIVVKDSTNSDISGSVGAASSVSFDFDYDNNTQRGAASAGVDAPVTIVAIGLVTAQFVLTQGTIGRSKANNFSLVSALERNYSNP